MTVHICHTGMFINIKMISERYFLRFTCFVSNQWFRDLESYLITFLSPFNHLAHAWCGLQLVYSKHKRIVSAKIKTKTVRYRIINQVAFFEPLCYLITIIFDKNLLHPINILNNNNCYRSILGNTKRQLAIDTWQY
jgi:hypothetical protein